MVEKVKQLNNETYFIEEFIDGREFNISILAGKNGPQVMPPAEIRFLDYPANKPKVVGYTAKWKEDSFEYIHTQRTFEYNDNDTPLLKKLETICLQTWNTLGLRGYVRVDFRIDPDGNPLILEVNTNPCISPDSGFVAACKHAGLSNAQMIERIIEDAFRK